MPVDYLHDSLNEGKVADLLREAGLRFETQAAMPVADWPWKTSRSRGAPKADFFIPDIGVYVEVKGWMTLFALSKSAWLCRQPFPYFLFQNDDESWEPFVDSPCALRDVDRRSTAALRRSSNRQQIEELRWFAEDGGRLASMNTLIRGRIRRHIEGRVATFSEWAGSFP